MEEDACALKSKIRKNLYVCYDRECNRRHSCSSCLSFDEFIPDDCEYAIFHPLETIQAQIAQQGRQTGKTTRLMTIAKKMADAGCNVYYVMPAFHMIEHTMSRFGKPVGLRFFSMGQIKNHTVRGHAPGYIIADEIPASELGFVEMELVGSKVVAAHWT